MGLKDLFKKQPKDKKKDKPKAVKELKTSCLGTSKGDTPQKDEGRYYPEAISTVVTSHPSV